MQYSETSSCQTRFISYCRRNMPVTINFLSLFNIFLPLVFYYYSSYELSCLRPVVRVQLFLFWHVHSLFFCFPKSGPICFIPIPFLTAFCCGSEVLWVFSRCGNLMTCFMLHVDSWVKVGRVQVRWFIFLLKPSNILATKLFFYRFHY